MPEHKPQQLEFLCDDAKSFFEAFCREFKGRKIEYRLLADNRILLDSADAMEFMYTYTWGPESFPYEVREQYGVLPYDEYCEAIQSWLGDNATILPIAHSEAVYLQPGYVTALTPCIKLMDEGGKPVDFPPSNAIIVIEKK